MLRVGLLSRPDASEVVAGLFIGSVPNRRAVAALSRAGVSDVIDLRLDGKRTLVRWPTKVTVWSYPLAEYEAPSPKALRDIARHVSELMVSGATVFIHCRAGVQRAPMVACAVLMEDGWTLAEAYRAVTRSRAAAALSDAQLEALGRLGVREKMAT